MPSKRVIGCLSVSVGRKSDYSFRAAYLLLSSASRARRVALNSLTRPFKRAHDHMVLIGTKQELAGRCQVCWL